jgi:hypothetical protein
MDGFEIEALRRLPLAQSVLSLFSYVLSEPMLDAVFEEHRGRCYEGVLTFPTLVDLVRDAMLIHQGHGLPSFQRAEQDGQLPVLVRSVYPKLGRLPEDVSVAMLRESSLKMIGLFDQADSPVPPSLQSFQVIAFDGKTIKQVRRQLKELRPLRGALAGGKLLVAQDVRTGMALAMEACQDADRNDSPLVPDVVEQVRGMFQSSKLWMGDRQFCDLTLMGVLTERGEHFLIRMNRTLGFTPDPARPARNGVDSRGRNYTQEWGWIGSVKDKRRRYVRKITLYRPDIKDGDVILLSDLTDDQLHPAMDLLDAYLMRWGIEQMFQIVTEVFCLNRLIGCTPKANIFQASFCFVIYNAIQVMRSYVAQAGQVATEEVSTAKLFDDVREELIAQSKLVPAEVVLEATGQVKTELEMKCLLKDLLGDQWLARWRKTPGNPRRTRGRTVHVKSGRSSVFKVLQKNRARRTGKRDKTNQRR